MSVTEGEDKPLKYPTIFNGSDVAILTKMDLSDVVEFDLAKTSSSLNAVRPGIAILDVSAKSGAGNENLCDFLRARRRESLHAVIT